MSELYIQQEPEIEIKDHQLTRISFSAWLKFRNDCQFRFKLDQVDGLKSESFGINLDFGKVIHRTIELLKPTKNKTPIGYPEKYFTRIFKWLYKRHSHLYKEKDLEVDLEKLIESGRRILRDVQEHAELNELQVWANEYEILDVISRTDNVDIKFKGFIDCILKGKSKRGEDILWIVDFKTCSWGWDREKKQDKELQAQLLLYKYFLCKKFKINPNLVRCMFILLKKRPGKKETTSVEFYQISAGATSVQRAVDEVNKDITQIFYKIQTNDFQKDRSKCTNQYGDKCPYLNTDKCTNDDIVVEPMKVIIAGSRGINDFSELILAIRNSGFKIGEVIEGECPDSPDILGKKYAKLFGLKCHEVPAKWKYSSGKIDKSAGHQRNRAMADNYGAEALICLWDGVSPGSKGMIEYAKKKGLQVYVHEVKKSV
jgi:hypothetical protein